MKNDFDFPNDCEVTLIELSIKSWKWLCIDLYKPPTHETCFLENVSLALTKMSCEYGNVMFIGDFNFTIDNKSFKFLMSALIWNP